MASTHQNSGAEPDEKAASAKSRLDRESLRETYWLFGYLKPYGRYFWPAFVALFLTAGLSMIWPYMIGQLIGGSVSSGGVDLEAVRANNNRVALILGGALALQAFVAYWRIRWFAAAGEQALADIRRDVYERIIRLPMAYFGEHRVGELSSRLSADLSLISETLITTVPQMVRQSVMLVVGLVFIFIFSSQLSLFMLASVPVIILLVAIFGRKIRQQSRAAQDELAHTSVVVEETLQGITNVKAFGNESYESNRYRTGLKSFVDATIHAARSRGAFVSFIIFALFGVIALVIWYGGRLLVSGRIAPNDFFSFILFSVFVGAALGSLPEIVSQLQKAVGATQRLKEIMAEEAEAAGVTEEPQGIAGGRLSGKLELREVSFRYPSRPDVQVLKSVSFRAEPGERIALVGPSGAGKSTIIGLLLRFYDPEFGAVFFDDQPAPDYDLKFLRSQMALVPQEVMLFGGSIRENIAYGRTGATEEEIQDAARKANAHDFISGFPERYETLVGERGVKLSGGQRQRIAIARAILADPAVLLLDEATSSLDSESERLVQEALDELMKGRTSVIIAHRLATVKDADRIVVINEGRAVQTGRHEELMEERDGLYRMLAQLQFA